MITKEEVRDGYLNDLPSDLIDKLMKISKLIADTCRDEIRSKDYDDIRNDLWCKSALDEFCTTPKNKSHVGSVRVYKKGKRFSCMIQITGHVDNLRDNFTKELFHEFIRDVHTTVRPKVRRKYDMTVTCESEHGEHFEGFDVWTKQKVAKEIWEKFEDKKTLKVKPMKESANDSTDRMSITASIEELPIGLQSTIKSLNESIYNSIIDSMSNSDVLKSNQIDKYSKLLKENAEVGYTELHMNSNGEYSGRITITPEVPLYTAENAVILNEKIKNIYSNAYKENCKEFKEDFNKNLVISGTRPNYYFEFTLEPTYVEALWNYLNEHVDEPMTEAVKVDKDKVYINTDMSIPEAKRTLGTLCMNIINNINKNKLPNQYTANIINNIVSKNLLPVWSNGYRKFTIIIDPKHHGMLQFKIPAVTHDFASKFVYGRESMNAFLHKNSDIKMIISPKVFKTLKNRDDLFFFIKDAIKYYDTNLIKYSEMIMHSLMRLNPGLKHTIANSKLSGIVACSLQMLVMFDDVDMSSKDVFKFNKEDINTVTSFIKNIYSNYASPEKEKKKILDDLQSIIDKIKGNTEYDENVKSIIDLTNVFNEFYSGKFNDDIEYYREASMKDCIDTDWSNNNPNTEIRMLQEATKIKKLKKLPRDLVAYISIEAESIRDANDKLMIASYCLDKLEIVEWYIELLEVGSKRYIVPHPMSYLRTLRTQLLQCYDKIMKVKIIPPSERPLIDIKY